MSGPADSGAPAVVLLSGGLDSSTALAWARAQGFECYALTVAYGQRPQSELDAAPRLARGLAGGLDSSTALAWARAQGFECYALTVAYGQRHQSELDAAARIARALAARE